MSGNNKQVDVYYITALSEIEGDFHHVINGCVVVPKGIDPVTHMKNIINSESDVEGRIYFSGGCAAEKGREVDPNEDRNKVSFFNNLKIYDEEIVFEGWKLYFSKLEMNDVILSSGKEECFEI